METPTISKLTSFHFYGWQKKLKTGMYYLRSKAATKAIQFSIDEQAMCEQKQNDESGQYICTSCSA
jgi:ribonucleotide reductase alpha subunit